MMRHRKIHSLKVILFDGATLKMHFLKGAHFQWIACVLPQGSFSGPSKMITFLKVTFWMVRHQKWYFWEMNFSKIIKFQCFNSPNIFGGWIFTLKIIPIFIYVLLKWHCYFIFFCFLSSLYTNLTKWFWCYQ